VATTQVELAGLLIARARPGDEQRASGLLDACLSTCRELDMPGLGARAETLRQELAGHRDQPA
jgi:hypothetical protein